LAGSIDQHKQSGAREAAILIVHELEDIMAVCPGAISV
jgi:hypothetical protein